jgi:hypothetical protein
VVGASLVSDQDGPCYVGTANRVTLRWGECFNGIASRPSGQREGYSWRARESPAHTGDFETVPPLREHSTALHYARGSLHFISRSYAILRRDTGGTLDLNASTFESDYGRKT